MPEECQNIGHPPQLKLEEILLNNTNKLLTPQWMKDALPSPSSTQVGGSHYKDMAIQPMEFCMKNRFDYATSNVIKYVTRRKGDKEKRAEDLRKAIHCIQLLAEHEGITL